VVDYKTCKVVPDAYVDIWSSNSTGIYTGVQGYPGMGDPKDASILKLTALRGVQPTDANGIATFDGIFPGHYDGRATHIHGRSILTEKMEAPVKKGKKARENANLSKQPSSTSAPPRTPTTPSLVAAPPTSASSISTSPSSRLPTRSPPTAPTAWP
jgi:hypothetical protein